MSGLPGGPRGARGGGGAGPLAAALADVGLLPGVLAHVRDEGAGLREGLAAHHALARLLACGQGQDKGRHPRPPPPPRAFPRPRAPPGRAPTGVDADVPLQGAGVGELPLAVDAHVRLLPAVDPQVPLEVPCGETAEGA